MAELKLTERLGGHETIFGGLAVFSGQARQP
jgi:hypothetical protein